MWPKAVMPRQLSMADMTFSCARLTLPALADGLDRNVLVDAAHPDFARITVSCGIAHCTESAATVGRFVDTASARSLDAIVLTT
jgi:hypothetical protein